MKIQHGERNRISDFGFRISDFKYHAALSWRAGGIVQRTEKPLFAFQQRNDFLLVPEMVAAGDYIHAGGENLLSRLGRDAGTPGGVFTVGDDGIKTVLLAQLRNELFGCATARFTHDVADEKQFHGADGREKAADCRMEA